MATAPHHATLVKRLLLPLLASSLVASASSTFAGLDIIETGPEGAEPVYVVADTDTGRVVGTFWDRANDSSDYGFESSIVPSFTWSPGRDYVAVTGGASRSSVISLYRVTSSSLKEIPFPTLDDSQAAPLTEISDVAAEGIEPVRWQQDGTLLVRFWADEHVTSDDQVQKRASVWADVEIDGNTARIVGTSTEEPSAPGTVDLPPNPAPPSGPTLADAGGGASAPAFEFDGRAYFLRGDEAGIREYLTEGETFQDWNTLVSIRRMEGADDARAYAAAMVMNAEASNPNAVGQVLADEDAGSYIADFVVYSEEGAEPFFAEWNLWRIEIKNDGIEALQYARRFYDVTDATAQQIEEARHDIIPQLANLEIP